MRNHGYPQFFFTFFLVCLLISKTSMADDLTAMIQVDLVNLGYEVDNTGGELTIQTVIAISKFQAENEMEVTGEATPQLAGILSARVDKQSVNAADSAAPELEPDPGEAVIEDPVDAETLRLAQEACIQEKVNEAEAKRKKQSGFNSLMSAVGRSAGQLGSDDVASATGDISSASTTAADLSSAAKDLGVTEDDLEECKNPL
jgi:hypothetical protein